MEEIKVECYECKYQHDIWKFCYNYGRYKVLLHGELHCKHFVKEKENENHKK